MPTLPKAPQERFCQEYLKDLNASRAYRVAYPKSSKKSAEACASRLLATAKVAQRVAELQAVRSQRVELESDEVLRELKLLLSSSIDDYSYDDETGHLTVKEGVPAAKIRAVSKLKIRSFTDDDGNTTRTFEFGLWDKTRAIDLAGKHLGMWIERVRHEGGGVLIVPGPVAPADWEKMVEAQRKIFAAPATG